MASMKDTVIAISNDGEGMEVLRMHLLVSFNRVMLSNSFLFDEHLTQSAL
jgi:hypothetical protein